MAFASIDWHGFVVVETITIDETDFETPLPAPTTLLELQRVSLQQRQLGLLLDGGNTNVSPLEEDLAGGVKAKDTKNTFDHEPETNEKLKNSEKSISMEIDTDTEPPLNNNPLSSVGASLKPKDFMTQKPLGKGPPRLGATLPPESTLTGPIRVKKEVIPRKTKLDEPTQVCPRCGQSILISEMDEHMRIELLDPKWREQRQAYEQAKRETNLNKEGEQVVHSLKTFAEYRKDIFGGDEVDLQKKIEEDLERQRELSKKKVIWDGHTASIATATQKVKEIVPLDEQIMSIHKAKGLIEEPNVHGPTAPWVQAPSTFPNLSSYPTNSHYSMVYQNPMLHPKPPNYHHPRLETEEELEYEAKRMKIMEVLVHEDTWISQHPHTIMIHVQVPEVKEFPLCTNQWMALEFHLRQTVYQVKEQISTILDVPVHQLELGVPISSPEGTEVIFTKNQFSLAYYNLPETTNAVLKILV
ncbi:SF3a splicing factor complex subunit [Coelomomyces lativittatus]|nr:SF3a splicing factor complex subunit [Coelomomyces lativittatus]